LTSEFFISLYNFSKTSAHHQLHLRLVGYLPYAQKLRSDVVKCTSRSSTLNGTPNFVFDRSKAEGALFFLFKITPPCQPPSLHTHTPSPYLLSPKNRIYSLSSSVYHHINPIFYFSNLEYAGGSSASSLGLRVIFPWRPVSGKCRTAIYSLESLVTITERQSLLSKRLAQLPRITFGLLLITLTEA